MDENENVLRKDFFSKKIYNRLYGSVVTRCFGYGVPCTSMIPMADNMNHVDIGASSYEVINPRRHLAPDRLDKTVENNTYFTTEKFLNNYEMIFTNAEIDCYEKDIKGHFNRDAYNRNLNKRKPEYWQSSIEKDEIQIWDLNLGEGECLQDNDSEDSEENEDE